MAVNWGALGAFAAGAALLVGYELLRPKTAMAADIPPVIPPVMGPTTPPPAPPPAPPIPPAAGQAPTGGGVRTGYDLDTGDRLSIYVRGPRAQATTTNDELRELFRRLGYDVLVTSDGPGTPEFAYKTVEILGATYQSERVPPILAPDVRVSSVATATGSPKGMIQS